MTKSRTDSTEILKKKWKDIKYKGIPNDFIRKDRLNKFTKSSNLIELLKSKNKLTCKLMKTEQ